jgi:hypothetical protein
MTHATSGDWQSPLLRQGHRKCRTGDSANSGGMFQNKERSISRFLQGEGELFFFWNLARSIYNIPPLCKHSHSLLLFGPLLEAAVLLLGSACAGAVLY